MNIRLDTCKRIVWLSYEYLLEHDVPEGTLNRWSVEGQCDRIYLDGRAFLDYDTIPAPTRRKLPSKEEIKAEYYATINAARDAFFLARLQDAYNGKEFVKWIDRIKDAYEGLTPERITECARRASVFERLTDILECNVGQSK